MYLILVVAAVASYDSILSGMKTRDEHIGTDEIKF
jgi:hypothetical protein